MPIHILKNAIPRLTNEQKRKHCYTKYTIKQQLGICKEKIRKNSKTHVFSACKYEVLLGMPDIETLHVLTINCNKAYTQTQIEQIYNKTEDKMHKQTKCWRQASLRSAM